MLEPTKEQLKELHKDIMSGDVMTLTSEHYKQLEQQIKQLEAEIVKVTKIANSRDCDSCGQKHRIDVMCPPVEVRMRGDCWYHKAIKRQAERIKELEDENRQLTQMYRDREDTITTLIENNDTFQHLKPRIERQGLRGKDVPEDTITT